jgi:hypothetical protein
MSSANDFPARSGCFVIRVSLVETSARSHSMQASVVFHISIEPSVNAMMRRHPTPGMHRSNIGQLAAELKGERSASGRKEKVGRIPAQAPVARTCDLTRARAAHTVGGAQVGAFPTCVVQYPDKIGHMLFGVVPIPDFSSRFSHRIC